MSSLTVRKTSFKTRTITAVLAVAAAVALPQLFHAIGIISGTGSAPGAAFLPMHLPVIIAALLGGPVVGAVAGITSCLISYFISGMPSALSLPFIILEIAAYGIAGGFLSKTKMPVIVKLLIIQIAGRLVRGLAVVISVYGLGNNAVPISSILTMITSGLPGILLQLILIPLIMYRIKDLNKYYE